MAQVQRAPSPDLPEIRVGTDVLAMADAAIEAISSDGSIFERTNALCHVVLTVEKPKAALTKSVDGGIRRETGSPIIVKMEQATLYEKLTANIRWTKWDGKQQKDVATKCPKDVCAAVLARKQWPSIRHLHAVVTAPTVRPDGTILQEPGYDEPTGLLYLPNADYPEIDDRADFDAALAAKESLLSVVQDFPFKDLKHHATAIEQAAGGWLVTMDCGHTISVTERADTYSCTRCSVHLSAWFAFLLTCVARSAFEGTVPLWAIDATTRGTGKSRIVQATSRIAYGVDAAGFTPEERDEETRKRVSSLLLAGERLVLLDNVEKEVGGATLNALLTNAMWGDRVMGTQMIMKVPNIAIWSVTGNNLTFDSDCTRRTIRIRLESLLENPEDREDLKEKNLLRWISSQRNRLVAQAITVVRAWFNANRPQCGVKPMGSFEEWSEFIPPICVWLGMPNPLLARATADESLDPDRLAMLNLMKSMNGLDPHGQGITTTGIIHALFPPLERGQDRPRDEHEDTRETINDVTHAKPGMLPSSVRLGKYLTKVRGRNVRGMKIEREKTSDTATCRWFVRKITSKGEGEES